MTPVLARPVHSSNHGFATRSSSVHGADRCIGRDSDQEARSSPSKLPSSCCTVPQVGWLVLPVMNTAPLPCLCVPFPCFCVCIRSALYGVITRVHLEIPKGCIADNGQPLHHNQGSESRSRRGGICDDLPAIGGFCRTWRSLCATYTKQNKPNMRKQ